MCFDTIEIKLATDAGVLVPFFPVCACWNFGEPLTITFCYKNNAISRDASFSLEKMKRKVYCCDAARDLYEEYYDKENGGEIPVNK